MRIGGKPQALPSEMIEVRQPSGVVQLHSVTNSKDTRRISGRTFKPRGSKEVYLLLIHIVKCHNSHVPLLSPDAFSSVYYNADFLF
jgi:hypothetical protein